MNILGVGDVTHDASTCLAQDGHIISAIEGERLTRLKHNLNLLPDNYTIEKQGNYVNNILTYWMQHTREQQHKQTIDYCLQAAALSWEEIDLFVVSSLFDQAAFANTKHVQTIEHHVAHCASTFYPSPFEEAAVLSIDGYGKAVNDQAICVMFAHGNKQQLDVLDSVTGYHDLTYQENQNEIKGPHIVNLPKVRQFKTGINLLFCSK